MLEDISFSVESRECVALLGCNGAGKSTLLRVIAGLLRPERGRIVMESPGASQAQRSVWRRREIGYLGHRLLMYPHLTGRENLLFFASLYGLDRAGEAVASSLENVGLSPAADRPLRTYSRGMGQRLALARALLHRPRLLLLDEPFSGLDSSARDLLEERIFKHTSQGGTVLLTSHDLERTARICSRGLVLASQGIAMELRKEHAEPGEWEERYRRILEQESTQERGKDGQP